MLPSLPMTWSLMHPHGSSPLKCWRCPAVSIISRQCLFWLAVLAVISTTEPWFILVSMLCCLEARRSLPFSTGCFFFFFFKIYPFSTEIFVVFFESFNHFTQDDEVVLYNFTLRSITLKMCCYFHTQSFTELWASSHHYLQKTQPLWNLHLTPSHVILLCCLLVSVCKVTIRPTITEIFPRHLRLTIISAQGYSSGDICYHRGHRTCSSSSSACVIIESSHAVSAVWNHTVDWVCVTRLLLSWKIMWWFIHVTVYF